MSLNPNQLETARQIVRALSDKVPLSPSEQTAYDRALSLLVDTLPREAAPKHKPTKGEIVCT